MMSLASARSGGRPPSGPRGISVPEDTGLGIGGPLVADQRADRRATLVPLLCPWVACVPLREGHAAVLELEADLVELGALPHKVVLGVQRVGDHKVLGGGLGNREGRRRVDGVLFEVELVAVVLQEGKDDLVCLMGLGGDAADVHYHGQEGIGGDSPIGGVSELGLGENGTDDVEDLDGHWVLSQPPLHHCRRLPRKKPVARNTGDVGDDAVGFHLEECLVGGALHIRHVQREGLEALHSPGEHGEVGTPLTHEVQLRARQAQPVGEAPKDLCDALRPDLRHPLLDRGPNSVAGTAFSGGEDYVLRENFHL
eukprot:Sspe_Gene.25655::Locus_10355_Transcript_1_1_Confidence_1.000_Length_1650::g.25655::m.25655